MQGNLNFYSIKEKFSAFLKGDKKVKIIVGIGVLGIILILLSDFLAPKQTKDDTKAANNGSSLVTSNQVLQQEIYELITSIEGVGRAKVMVTLENSGEYVYAKEEKTNTDLSEDMADGQNKKTTKKDNAEEKYIFVDGSDGGKQALLTTEKAPRVKGVVVVCEGGDNKMVQSRIIDAITTAFDIGSNRVCVTKISLQK